jgi:hypothetical protein
VAGRQRDGAADRGRWGAANVLGNFRDLCLEVGENGKLGRAEAKHRHGTNRAVGGRGLSL